MERVSKIKSTQKGEKMKERRREKERAGSGGRESFVGIRLSVASVDGRGNYNRACWALSF